MVQGGEDAEDSLSSNSLSRKEPIIIELFCGKRPIKIRNPMPRCHPVAGVMWAAMLIVVSWHI